VAIDRPSASVNQIYQTKENTMKLKTAILIATLSAAPLLGGCAAGLVAPVIAGTNMAKNGPIAMKIEGKGDAITAFRRSIVEAGGTVPRVSDGYAEGQFMAKAVRVELQHIERGLWAVAVTTTASRSWDFEDSIAKTADAISSSMNKAGFITISRERSSGI
jgi:hypothetical protein